jgi:hypothetical protein
LFDFAQTYGNPADLFKMAAIRPMSLEADCFVTVEPGYLASVLPKLNVVPIDKLFCVFHGRSIVSAFNRNRLLKVAVRPDETNTIFGQMPLLRSGGTMQRSPSPVGADGGR